MKLLCQILVLLVIQTLSNPCIARMILIGTAKKKSNFFAYFISIVDLEFKFISKNLFY